MSETTETSALDRLGLAITDAGYTWTSEMRKAYEEAVAELERARANHD